MDTFRRAFLPYLSLIAAFAIPLRAGAQNIAEAYVVMDATTGHVLMGGNIDKKLQVASLTKIATAMVVLDWADATKADLAQLATVPPQASALGADPVSLQPGDQMTLRDLLYTALMQSDNTAALTLAVHVGQKLPHAADVPADYAFVAQMNALARKLRMEHTLFLNPHGLDSMKGKLPYSTAADIARLAAYAMGRRNFHFYVSQKEREIAVLHADNTQGRYLLRNTNELLGVNNIDGVKTGTTARAGQCLVISSARPPESVQNGETYIITPRRLIVVVLGAGDRYKAAGGLLNRGWQLYDEWAAKGRPLQKGEGLVLQ